MKTDSLHQLIHSLNSQEKRFFKLYVKSNQNNHTNNYLLLFDAMNKLTIYDEVKLIQKLGSNNTTKNLAQNKKYLKDLILKSVHNIDDNLPESLVSGLMKEQQFLSKKNLFKEQWKKLQKAKKIAIEQELFDKHLNILDIEMRYLNEHNFDKAITQYPVYKKEKEILLTKSDLYNRLIISKNFVFHCVSRYRNKINSQNLALVKEEINQYDENQIAEIDSFIIKMWHYNNCSNYHLLANETQKQFEYQQKLVQLFDEYPQFKISSSRRYLIIFFNYLGAIFKLEKFDLLKEKLDEVSTIKIKNENDKGEFYQNYILYRLLYAMNTDKLQKAISENKETLRVLDKYKKKINASSLLTLYYNYALIFFFAEDFDNTILWLEKIKNIKADVRKDIQSFACVLTIICHYELGNFLLIESLQRSASRRHQLSQIEKTITTSIRKLATLSPTNQKAIWEKMENELNNTKERVVGKDLLKIWIGCNIADKESIYTLYKKLIMQQ